MPNPLALILRLAELLTDEPARKMSDYGDTDHRILDLYAITEPEAERLLALYGSEEALHQAWRDQVDLLRGLVPSDDFVPEVVQTTHRKCVATPWAGPVSTDWLLRGAAEHLMAAAALRDAEKAVTV